jgi:O-antigen/teichoic acid export membrane protein
LSGGGLPLTATKFIAEHRATSLSDAFQFASTALTLASILGSVVALGSFFMARVLSTYALGAPHLSHDIALGSGYILFSAISSVQVGVLIGLEEFRGTTILSIARAVLQIILMISGSHYWGLGGAIIGMTVAEGVTVVIAVNVLKGVARSSGHEISAGLSNWKDAKSLLSFSLPAFLASLVTQPAIWLSSILVVRQSAGFVALGIFNAADRYRQLLIFLPVTLSPIALALLSNLHGAKNNQDYRRVLRWNLLVTLLFVLLPSLLLMGFASRAMGLFGEEYRAGALTLVILSGSALFVALNTALGQSLVSTGQIWWRFVLDVFLAGSLLFFSSLFVPSMKDAGLALANVLAYAISVIGLLLLTWRMLRSHAGGVRVA